MDTFRSNLHAFLHPAAVAASRPQSDIDVQELAVFFTMLSVLIFMVSTMTGMPSSF